MPKKKKTHTPTWTKRQILDGVFYQLKNGCNWADLPKDLPPYSTVYWHYKQWRASGVVREIMTALHQQVRAQAEKKPKLTTLIIVDSKATKNTCNASTESKVFCSYKATNGIKKNLGADALGLPFFTLCTKASLSLEAIYPQIMTKIRFKVAPKMSKQQKQALGISGFVVIPMRWVVERSNAWMDQCQNPPLLYLIYA